MIAFYKTRIGTVIAFYQNIIRTAIAFIGLVLVAIAGMA
jgi:hypothetical protein